MTTDDLRQVAETADYAERLYRECVSIVGAEQVSLDRAARTLHSQDLWQSALSPVSLVVSPTSLDQLSRVVAAASRAGFAIAPRGAGMSYTGGFIPGPERTICLDTSRMNRILSIRAEDMTVTVEPGVSWMSLHAALAPLGLRTPFWGPMSGVISTIGAGLSQYNAMLGAGHYGNSSESVVALTIVLADGSLLRTGARGPDGNSPFYRYYGPDLAGLFCGDCGVFGIKGEITLRLIRTPAYEDFVSFSFKTGRELLKAMAEMARAGIACEMCAFDPDLTRIRLARASLGSDVKALGAVVARQKSIYKGLLAAGKVALAGRSFVGVDDYSLHVICEGRSQAAVQSDVAEARRIAALQEGRSIENTIAKIIRAVPFPVLNNVLGPRGERFVPTHGHAPLSQAPAILDEIQNLFAEMSPSFSAAGVATGILFSSLSTNALIIEPMFYWPDEHFAIHETAIESAHLAKLPPMTANPASTAVVANARKRLIGIFERFGCAHFQIGRTYPYRASRDEASWRLIEALKNTVDPQRSFNPGGLGLAPAPTAAAAAIPAAPTRVAQGRANT